MHSVCQYRCIRSRAVSVPRRHDPARDSWPAVDSQHNEELALVQGPAQNQFTLCVHSCQQGMFDECLEIAWSGPGPAAARSPETHACFIEHHRPGSTPSRPSQPVAGNGSVGLELFGPAPGKTCSAPFDQLSPQVATCELFSHESARGRVNTRTVSLFGASFENHVDFFGQAIPGDGRLGPIQRGPKRKQVYIWQCCQCGQTRNPIRSDACYNCGIPRCAYCPVSKVKI